MKKILSVLIIMTMTLSVPVLAEDGSGNILTLRVTEEKGMYITVGQEEFFFDYLTAITGDWDYFDESFPEDSEWQPTDLDISKLARTRMNRKKTLMPLRPFAEALGMKVEWSDDGPVNVRLVGKKRTAMISVGSDSALVSSGSGEPESVALTSPAIIYNDRIFVSIDDLHKLLDCNAIIYSPFDPEK